MEGEGGRDTETIGFLGGDARMAHLARLMAADGYAVKLWGLPGEDETHRPGETLCADRIILPTPMVREGRLNGTPLLMEEFWPRLRQQTPVYAGAVGEAERICAERLGLRLTDYLADEALAVENAVPTAEGALAAAMEHLSVTLHGTPCLVMGFGRVGKVLARDLAALGAEVSVSARNAADLAWIGTLGCRALHTQRLADELASFRAVFNTVPQMILDDGLVRRLRRDCVVIELASQPGVDERAARAHGVTFVKALGLPGKVAPETAARAIQKTLYRIWEDERT